MMFVIVNGFYDETTSIINVETLTLGSSREGHNYELEIQMQKLIKVTSNLLPLQKSTGQSLSDRKGQKVMNYTVSHDIQR